MHITKYPFSTGTVPQGTEFPKISRDCTAVRQSKRYRLTLGRKELDCVAEVSIGPDVLFHLGVERCVFLAKWTDMHGRQFQHDLEVICNS